MNNFVVQWIHKSDTRDVCRVLRNTETGKFYRGGKWVADWHKAQEFDFFEAARTVRELGLKDVELYYVYGDERTQYDWTIRLS